MIMLGISVKLQHTVSTFKERVLNTSKDCFLFTSGKNSPNLVEYLYEIAILYILPKLYTLYSFEISLSISFKLFLQL